MHSQQDGEEQRPDLITGVSTLERVAQGRGGLTTGLDLGTLNRQNVDEEVRQSSGGSGRYSGGSSSTYESYGGGAGGAGAGYYGAQQAGSASSSRTQTSSSSSSSSHSSSSGSSHRQQSGGGSSYSQHQQGAAYGGVLGEEDLDDYEYEDGEDGYDNAGTNYGTSKIPLKHFKKKHL